MTHVPPSIAHMRQNMKIEAPMVVRFLRMERGTRALVSMYHSQVAKIGTSTAPRTNRRMIRQSTDQHVSVIRLDVLTRPGVVVTSPLKSEK
jgi:hypothetical protein